MSGTEIKSVTARQVMTRRHHPGVEATVVTENGAEGVAVCTAGVSVGTHEIKFSYDGGVRWEGKGVQGAVDNANNVIAPKLIGLNCANQWAIDQAMLDICPDAKVTLGGNAVAAVSAAALKAGAKALDIPLYQHIGGANAMYLPVPGIIAAIGSERYGGDVRRSGGKPSYALMCYGFDTFSDASYAGWELDTKWRKVLSDKFDLSVGGGGAGMPNFPRGLFKSDREIWDLMVDTIDKAGYNGKVGIQVDIAADTFYNQEDGIYYGLLSAEPKTRDDLLRLYEEMVANWPFVDIEDPFNENDYESHAELVRRVDIQIVGDDLFTTNPERVAYGISKGAANTVLLKVNQVGTITEALEMIQLAYKHNYGVMPCESRGEGDAIADYCVGINAGSVRESAIGDAGNRFLKIEAELGSRAKFIGAKGFKGKRFQS